jgi:hypothetical protein
MAVTSFGWRGTVNEQEIAEIMTLAGLRSSVAGDADWKPSAVAGDRRVAVAAGTGYAAFIKAEFDSASIIDLPTPAVAQWFLIVNRRKWSDKSGEFIALAGATTSSTVPTTPPTLLPAGFANEPGVLFDQEIAWVWARASTTALVLFDVRTFTTSATATRRRIELNGVGTGAVFSSTSVSPVTTCGTAIILTARSWMRVEGSIYCYTGSNAAGNLYPIASGITRSAPRRYHSHGREGYTFVPFEFEFELPAGTYASVGLAMSRDSGGQPIELWDSFVGITVNP